jgi:alpha-ribazole phosphatase
VVAKIYLIRHGETKENRLHRIQGHNDSPLNERGRQQAQRLYEELKDVSFEAVYSSPALRAKESAEYFSDQIIVVQELRELGWGKLGGFTWKEVHERFPDITRRQAELGYDFAPPEGETGREVIERGMALIEELACKHTICCCVTHAGFLRLLIAHLLSMDYSKISALDFDNGSFTVIRHSKNKWKVNCLNCG